METKRCGHCKQTKSVELFYKNKTNPDGLNGRCKECADVTNVGNRRKLPGLAYDIYRHQVRVSKVRKHPLPNYTKDELNVWISNQPNFDMIYNNWIQSNYNRWQRPSVDRIDDNKPYTMDNIQLMTWKENNNKGHRDRRNGLNNKMSKAVLQYDIEGCFIKEFYSMRQAERELKIGHNLIKEVCNGTYKYAGGYIWKYKNT